MPDHAPEFFDRAEDCEERAPREILARHGFTPLPPSELDDRQLPGRLWELLYAEEADRTPFAPDEIIPPHEDPPFDRDRFLPTAPIPLEAHAGWLPGDDNPAEETNDEADSPGLAGVDREIAAAKSEANPDAAPPFALPNPALEAQLRASEPENWTPPAQQLTEQNIPLLPPAEITDETLTPILWELLHNLALRGFYVQHSDHLSDRELYAELWERGLRDPAHLPGRNPRGGWFHDFLGSWGEDDMQLWLRYYATDNDRARHAKDYPKDKLPPKEKPPCNRAGACRKGRFNTRVIRGR